MLKQAPGCSHPDILFLVPQTENMITVIVALLTVSKRQPELPGGLGFFKSTPPTAPNVAVCEK